MNKVDMSAKAVTARLKRVGQLRRLGLALQKAQVQGPKLERQIPGDGQTVKPGQPKTK